MSKKEISVKGAMSPQTVATVLEDLLQSFKKGKMVIQNGEEFVILQPGELINLELEAGSRKDKEKLVLELTWQRKSEAEEPARAFTISSREPPAELEAGERADRPDLGDESVVTGEGEPMTILAGAESGEESGEKKRKGKWHKDS